MAGFIRYLGAGSSMVVLAYGTLLLFGPDGEILFRAPDPAALLIMSALAAIGILLGRVPGAGRIAAFAGAVAGTHAAYILAKGSEPYGNYVEAAYLIAALTTIVCGVLISRAEGGRRISAH